MILPVAVPIVAAFAACALVSPLPEFPTELYILPYITVNLAISLYLRYCGSTISFILYESVSKNCIFFLASILLTIIRRLYFSPLSKFPGPKLAAASGLWNANEARLGRASKTHKTLHERFGNDVIRIGPNELSINDPSALEKLYGGKYIRGNFSQVFNISGGDSVATVRDHQRHSTWRRMLAGGFTKPELSPLLARLQIHVNRTVGILREQGGKFIDCGKLLDALAFDVILDLAFSLEGGLQEGHGDFKIVNLINGLFPPIQVLGHLPHVTQILRYLPPNKDGRQLSLLGDSILSRMDHSQKTPRKDIFTHLQTFDRDSGLTMSSIDLRQHVLLVMNVGLHSISTTLTQILTHLASRPDIQTRVATEVYNASSVENSFSIDRINTLPFLDAVVKEGLRKFPPLLGGTPAIAPKGGVTLECGAFIPENTQVWVAQHVLMSDDRYFPRANEFLPERWLEQTAHTGGKSETLLVDRRAWIPFGYGAHACGGRIMAMQELKLIIAKVVGNFEIQYGQDDFEYGVWKDSWKDYFLTMIEKVELRFVPRPERT